MLRRAIDSGRISGRISDRGATAVEYGLMVALVAVVIVGMVAIFGQAVRDLFIIPVEAL